MGEAPTPPSHVPFGQSANPDNMSDDDVLARIVDAGKGILKHRHNPAMTSMQSVIDAAMNEDTRRIVATYASPSLVTMLRRNFAYYLAGSFWSPFVKQLEPGIRATSEAISPVEREIARKKFNPVHLLAVLKMNVETYGEFWAGYKPASITRYLEKDAADLFLQELRFLKYPVLVGLVARQQGCTREEIEQQVEACVTRWNSGYAPELEATQWVRRPAQWGLPEPLPVHAR